MGRLVRWIQPLRRLDWVALSCTLMLLAAGVVFIVSAGNDDPSTPLIRAQWFRQILFVCIGLPAYLLAARIDYRALRDYTGLIYGGCAALLIGVLIFGIEKNNSRSWYDLGVVDFQPAELAKIGLIFTLAAFLGDPLRNARHPRCIFTALALSGVYFGLILLQPDLGTAMILPCIVLAMLFAAGLPWRVLALMILLGLMALPLAWTMAKDYQKERVLVFLDPDRDPLGQGWNRMQSEMAVGSGGLRGKGFKQGTVNLLGFLPTTVAPTDFIFSVIAEEQGFIGASLVVGLFSVLFIRLARTALRAPDGFGRLIAVGILAMVFVHVTINVAMTVGLMPIVGLPLPLVSYGGSFVLSMMLALGLAQSVHIRRG